MHASSRRRFWTCVHLLVSMFTSRDTGGGPTDQPTDNCDCNRVSANPKNHGQLKNRIFFWKIFEKFLEFFRFFSWSKSNKNRLPVHSGHPKKVGGMPADVQPHIFIFLFGLCTPPAEGASVRMSIYLWVCLLLEIQGGGQTNQPTDQPTNQPTNRHLRL